MIDPTATFIPTIRKDSSERRKMHVSIKRPWRSIPFGLTFEMPSFCLLTGKNGSGKTHLLEAMAKLDTAAVNVNGHSCDNRQYVGFGSLNPSMAGLTTPAEILSTVENHWEIVAQIIPGYSESIWKGNSPNAALEQTFGLAGLSMPKQAWVRSLLATSSKPLDRITHDDVMRFAKFNEMENGSLFVSQCALVFNAYHARKSKNLFNRFRNQHAPSSNFPTLTDDEFVGAYGVPPWELINGLLLKAKLPYEFNNPEGVDYELPFNLYLKSRINNCKISVNELSSGEKVLISLALAIYNSTERGFKPDLVLLDEPDASLHPEFSRLLIEILVSTIVESAGINVIMTTHSPSTVALAPEGSVYEMDAISKVPAVTTNRLAIENLTRELSFLRVSYEVRRQVFVEGRYDAMYFQSLYNTLARKYKFKFSPVFLEPHSGTANCTDVISIVNKLRQSGSDLAFGVIDFDLKNKPTEHISVLGAGSRYAVENFILDPIFIALSLIRYGKKNFADFGIGDKFAYTDAAHLTRADCQKLVDGVLAELGISEIEKSDHLLENGFMISYPRAFLLHKGHPYETLLQEKFNGLSAVSKGHGDSALKLGVLEVIGEFPALLSKDVSNTLVSILEIAGDAVVAWSLTEE